MQQDQIEQYLQSSQEVLSQEKIYTKADKIGGYIIGTLIPFVVIFIFNLRVFFNPSFNYLLAFLLIDIFCLVIFYKRKTFIFRGIILGNILLACFYVLAAFLFVFAFSGPCAVSDHC